MLDDTSNYIITILLYILSNVLTESIYQRPNQKMQDDALLSIVFQMHS